MNYGPLWLIPIFLIGFLVVHLAKMTRLYLVLMEQNIGLGKFILLYLRTTFVNLLIPFKLGEIYRIYSISRETGVWQVGVLSILVDRFFDIIGLFIVLLHFDFFIRGSISTITGIFLVVIVLLVCLYKVFMPTYNYLNEYLIVHKHSKRSMLSLRGLDIGREWFLFVKGLIRGRYALIIGTSLCGWLVEVAALKAFAMYMGITFGITDFPDYIKAIFASGNSELLSYYSLVSAALIGVITIIGYVFYLAERSKNRAGGNRA